MEQPYGLRLVLRWAICSVLAIGVLYYWMVMSVELSLPQVRVAVSSMLLLGLFVYVCFAPLLARDNLEKRVRYCITNKRVIIYCLSSNFTLIRDLKDVTEVHVHTLSTGRSDLVFGPYNRFIKHHMHDDVLAFIGTWKMEPIPFASILDVEGALQALPEHISIHSDQQVEQAAGVSKAA